MTLNHLMTYYDRVLCTLNVCLRILRTSCIYTYIRKQNVHTFRGTHICNLYMRTHERSRNTQHAHITYSIRVCVSRVLETVLYSLIYVHARRTHRKDSCWVVGSAHLNACALCFCCCRRRRRTGSRKNPPQRCRQRQSNGCLIRTRSRVARARRRCAQAHGSVVLDRAYNTSSRFIYFFCFCLCLSALRARIRSAHARRKGEHDPHKAAMLDSIASSSQRIECVCT